jgi:hypothetical protein
LFKLRKSPYVKKLILQQQFRALRKKQLGFLRVLFGVQNALSLYYQELL